MALFSSSSRRLTARAGAAIGVIFLISVLDAVISGHLQGKNLLRVVVGTSQLVSGDLATPVRSADELRYRPESRDFDLQIVEGRGRLWRGVVKVPLDASPGSYQVQVYSVAEREPEKAPSFEIVVMDSAQALQAADPSMLRRFFGVRPLWVAAASLPLLIVALLVSFRLSTQHEARLAAKGIVPIIKMVRRRDVWEITASRVGEFTVQPGDCLALLDSDFQRVAEMAVDRLEAGLILGHADLSDKIRPDCYVQLHAADRANSS